MSKRTKIKNSYKDNNLSENISLFKIFWTFFRVGLFTFGGGLAMATVIRYELVSKNHWITDDEFMSEFATATAIPGSIAVNIAYLQGYRFRGKIGTIAAIIGTILPSFITILIIAYFGMPYFNHPKVVAFFRGSSLAVAGQLLFTGFIFGKKLVVKWKNIVICLISLFIVTVVRLHPIWSLITAAVLGYFLYNKNNHTPIDTDR